MKKIVAVLILGALPAFALAAGEHAGGHKAHGQQPGQGTAGTQHEADASRVGKPGDPAKVNRTIDMTMDDAMRFSPSEINVKAGDTVRFSVRNTGKLPHELVIGSMQELHEHAEMMRKMPEQKHDEPNQITLAPGRRGDLVWRFDQAGAVDFACLIPGHSEAGMVGKVQVRR